MRRMTPKSILYEGNFKPNQQQENTENQELKENPNFKENP